MHATVLLLAALVMQPNPLRPAPVAPNSGEHVVVVCPPALAEATADWEAFRRAQGYRITRIAPPSEASALRSRIRALAEESRIDYVVLIGDVPDHANDGPPSNANLATPTIHAKAKVNVAWGSPPHIATDAPYADFDDDGLPDAAIGRIGADSPEQLRVILGKTLAHERSIDHGPWRRRLSFVAGVGNFGMFIDAVLDSVTKALLVHRIPAEYEMLVTRVGYRSPYYPGADRFRDATLASLGREGLFWVYIGHGQPFGCDWIQTPRGHYPILEANDIDRLTPNEHPPIAVFLCCYVGAFDAYEDCLAERLLASKNGPVAVYSASRVSMPYAMSVMGSELIDLLTSDEDITLGRAILLAKQHMSAPAEPIGDEPLNLTGPQTAAAMRRQLDTIAEAFRSKHYAPDEERREHALLFNLLGDPMLSVRSPRKAAVSAQVVSDVDGAKRLLIRGESPFPGEATIELCVRRDRLTFDRPKRTEAHRQEDALAEAHFQAVYARANDRRLAEGVMRVAGGPFEATLPIPENASGACCARVFIESPQGSAAGAFVIDLDAQD